MLFIYLLITCFSHWIINSLEGRNPDCFIHLGLPAMNTMPSIYLALKKYVLNKSTWFSQQLYSYTHFEDEETEAPRG